jgi:HEAT repeat protein/beta-lactamase regulating signal transducer with metallopeptidase domain
MTMFAWLLTYLIHSSVLLGLVWLVTRRGRLEPAVSELLWKVALLAGLVTGTIQSRLQVSPPAAVTLPAVALPAAPTVREPAAPLPDHSTTSRTSTTSTTSTVLPSLPLLAVVLWAAIALGSSLYYVARRLILVGRLADRRAVSDGPLVAALAELQRTARYRRRVRLTMARTISSPVALGLSEICVPELALSALGAEQQRSMLAHELAHLARRDSLWLGGASLIERCFFFQPLNRLARRELETTAEYLSDEWAMRRTGSPVALAKCLATVAEWIQAAPLGVPVAGLAERRSLLVSRISRLLEERRVSSPASRSGWAVAAALGVAVTIAAAPRVSQGVGGATPVPRVAAAGSSQDTTVVLALIARLKDENAGVRSAAARSLGRLRDPRAVPPLIAVLADSGPEVRVAAVEALAELADPRAIGPIAGLLKDPVTDVKRNALGALSHFDQGVPTAPVVALLDDPDADVRHEAIDALDHLRARSAAGAIARLIHDPSADVRHAAVEALGNLGAQSSAAAITDALSDASADVRQAALGALNDLRAPIAEATLLNLMKDPSADVRQRAAQLAGERSLVATIPQLRHLIDDTRSDVREAATEALGHIADPAARQALQAALQSPDPRVRRAAAEALGQDR